MANETVVNDVMCEACVLGTIISREGAFDEVREFLSDDCFYDRITTDIWKAIKSVDAKGGEISIVSVFAEMRKMKCNCNMSEVMEVTKTVLFGDLVQYALRLKELAVRRALWLLGHRLISYGVGEAEDLETVEHETYASLEQTFYTPSTNVKTLRDAYNEVEAIMVSNMKAGSRVTGTRTGFSRLDEKGGLQPSDLIIIAGESSQGKSSLAINMAYNALQNGKRVAIYSLEMMASQVAARIISSHSGVPSSSILYDGTMSQADRLAVESAVTAERKGEIYFDDTSTSNIETILNSIRYMKKHYDIDGAVIDYLQILNVNSKTMNPEMAMGDACRRLKNLAKDLKIWIIGLSQLARSKDNPEPSKSRLRSSGQIEEAADTIMLIYRPEVYGRTYPDPFCNTTTHNTAMIDVAKGRNIGTFKFIVGFNPSTTTFSNSFDNGGGLPDALASPPPMDEHPDMVVDSTLPF